MGLANAFHSLVGDRPGVLLHMRPKLPDLLFRLVAQVLEFVERYFVDFTQVFNAFAHALADLGDALGHNFKHLFVGEEAAGNSLRLAVPTIIERRPSAGLPTCNTRSASISAYLR